MEFRTDVVAAGEDSLKERNQEKQQSHGALEQAQPRHPHQKLAGGGAGLRLPGCGSKPVTPLRSMTPEGPPFPQEGSVWCPRPGGAGRLSVGGTGLMVNLPGLPWGGG